MGRKLTATNGWLLEVKFNALRTVTRSHYLTGPMSNTRSVSPGKAYTKATEINTQQIAKKTTMAIVASLRSRVA